MTKIEECQQAGYPPRTKQNVICSDITLAFAVDFYTGGEVLTKKLCIENNKPFISIDFKNKDLSYSRLYKIIKRFDTLNLKNFFGTKDLTINVAGNGIYRMKETQKEVNEWTYEFFQRLLSQPSFEYNIVMVRSGGQTGFDEAGVVAADWLGIPTLVLAPKNYLFRLEQGKDIADRELFEQRFNITP